MKTLTLFCTNNRVEAAEAYRQVLLQQHPRMPASVLDDALHHWAIQNVLFERESIWCGPSATGEDFYNESEEGRTAAGSDPIGSLSIRIDYDPNFSANSGEGADVDDPSYNRTLQDDGPHALFNNACNRLTFLHDAAKNPINAGVDHIRVAVTTAGGVVTTKNFFPVAYNDEVQFHYLKK